MLPETGKSMNMLTIYHNTRCRKSREALKLIEDSGQPFEIVEYLNQPLSAAELDSLLEKLEMEPLDLVRRNEAEWKTHFKGKELSKKEVIEAIARFPKLMERPVVVRGNKAVVGRPPENVHALIGN